MLLRVRDFGKAHPELFPESLAGFKALTAVISAIEKIESLTTERLTAVRQTRRDQAARRAVILDRMRSIARTSRRVIGPAGAPLRLRMPRKQSDLSVVAEARTHLADAEAYHDQFVSLGLPDGCVTDLRQALDAFEGALADRRLGRGGVMRVESGIHDALTKGADAAQTLDLVVRNRIVDDPGLLAEWERHLRIVEGIRRTKRATTAEATAAPGVTAPASAPEAKPTGEGSTLLKVV